MVKKFILHKNLNRFLHRIILATTNKGDTIFDPFLGTGTTAVVAKNWKKLLWYRKR